MLVVVPTVGPLLVCVNNRRPPADQSHWSINWSRRHIGVSVQFRSRRLDGNTSQLMVVSTVKRAETALAETPSDDEVGELSRDSGRILRGLAADALGYRGHCTVIRLREKAPTTRALFGRGCWGRARWPFARPSRSGWRHPPCTSRSAIISLAAGLSTVSEIFDGDEQHRPAESRAHACQDLERTEKHHLMATQGDAPRLMRVPTPSASSVPAERRGT
jgi:hypothetical protein